MTQAILRIWKWVRGRSCISHDPMFDRDAAGRAVFRCRHCMETWPVLAKDGTWKPEVARRRAARIARKKARAQQAEPFTRRRAGA